MRQATQKMIALVLLSLTKLSLAADVRTETILTGLDHPTGLAIRVGSTAENYELYVAESGSGRILKTASSEPHDKTDVITGFSHVPDSNGSNEHEAHCLLFLDERNLIVAVGGTPPDVRLYQLSENNTPLDADEQKQKLTPELQSNADDAAAGGICISLARTRANDTVPDMLLVALSGDDELSGVWKLPVRAGMLSSLSRSPGAVAGKPTALAVSEQGYLLMAAGSADKNKTVLLFANPTNGQPILSMETSLSEIHGLSYSPKSGNLYALAESDDAAGVFRIDDASKPGAPRVSEVKVADVPRPIALAFGPDGALFVTAVGEEDAAEKGVLLKITGEL